MAKLSIKNLLKATSLSLCLPMAALSGCIPSFPTGMVSEATEEPYDDVLNKVYTVDTETLGLTVDENGTILLAGKPYYAFGVNSFTLVTRYLEGAGETMYRDQFALLKKYNIPFVRVNFGGYWPAYYEQFDKDPEAVLRLMQDVVKCAEEYNIGLICSLLWYDSSISAHVGEHRSDMGDLNSKTVKYATEYVSRIVAEFKGSPAIWAWEIGNEYNLDADLCDPEYRSRLPVGPCTPQFPSGFDFYTSEELVAFYTAIGNAIRAQDPTRMISTGNGDLRNASKALHEAALQRDPKTHLWTENWKQDTTEEFYEMCAYFTPDPLDTICFHLQHAQQDESGKASFLVILDRFGSKISTLKYFKEYATAARKAKKALYFGEMGDMMWMEGNENAVSIFANVADWITDAGIQLASSWQFSENDLKATDEGIDGEKLAILQQKNQKYVDNGKADTVTYWSNK